MGHDHKHEGYDKHGNPEEFDEYLAKLDDPERDIWQKPDEVIAAMGLTEGDVVAEIGAGTGYFTFRLAEAVTKHGHVYGVEVDPRMLGVLAERLREKEYRHVTPVVGLSDDPLLPEASVDVVLMVNAFHHVENPKHMLKRVRKALKPTGRLFNVDFKMGDYEIGPPDDHKLSQDVVEFYAAEAGLQPSKKHDFLEFQYMVEYAVEPGKHDHRGAC